LVGNLLRLFSGRLKVAQLIGEKSGVGFFLQNFESDLQVGKDLGKGFCGLRTLRSCGRPEENSNVGNGRRRFAYESRNSVFFNPIRVPGFLDPPFDFRNFRRGQTLFNQRFPGVDDHLIEIIISLAPLLRKTVQKGLKKNFANSLTLPRKKSLFQPPQGHSPAARCVCFFTCNLSEQIDGMAHGAVAACFNGFKSL